MKLYGYWRSTATYRVRIALNLKNLPYENCLVSLVKDGGEQFKPDYVELNPAKLVPVLVDGDVSLNQSLAIVEYLDEQYPQNPLLPKDPALKARVRAMALDIATDIHPLNNLRVLKYLKGTLAVSDEAKDAWYAHWIAVGFEALETRLKATAGQFCLGDEVTMADVFLVPQIYNARRFNVPLDAFPTICRIEANCLALPAFDAAMPENQPDAE